MSHAHSVLLRSRILYRALLIWCWVFEKCFASEIYGILLVWRDSSRAFSAGLVAYSRNRLLMYLKYQVFSIDSVILTFGILHTRLKSDLSTVCRMTRIYAGIGTGKRKPGWNIHEDNWIQWLEYGMYWRNRARNGQGQFGNTPCTTMKVTFFFYGSFDAIGTKLHNEPAWDCPQHLQVLTNRGIIWISMLPIELI